MKKTASLLILFSLLISNTSWAQDDWKLEKNEDNVKVYTRTSESSNFKDSKALAEFSGSLQNVIDLLMNVETHKTWMDRVEESEMLKKISDSEYIAYYQIKAPWPVSNRDVVSNYKLSRLGQNKVKFTVKGKPNYIPEKDNLIRIKESESSWEIEEIEKGKIKIKLISKSDPGGNVPAWLANSAASENPFKTLLGLKSKIADN